MNAGPASQCSLRLHRKLAVVRKKRVKRVNVGGHLAVGGGKAGDAANVASGTWSVFSTRNKNRAMPNTVCRTCHASHVRCDGGQPCSRCISRGIECELRKVSPLAPKPQEIDATSQSSLWEDQKVDLCSLQLYTPRSQIFESHATLRELKSITGDLLMQHCQGDPNELQHSANATPSFPKSSPPLCEPTISSSGDRQIACKNCIIGKNLCYGGGPGVACSGCNDWKFQCSFVPEPEDNCPSPRAGEGRCCLCSKDPQKICSGGGLGVPCEECQIMGYECCLMLERSVIDREITACRRCRISGTYCAQGSRGQGCYECKSLGVKCSFTNLRPKNQQPNVHSQHQEARSKLVSSLKTQLAMPTAQSTYGSGYEEYSVYNSAYFGGVDIQPQPLTEEYSLEERVNLQSKAHSHQQLVDYCHDGDTSFRHPTHVVQTLPGSSRPLVMSDYINKPGACTVSCRHEGNDAQSPGSWEVNPSLVQDPQLFQYDSGQILELLTSSAHNMPTLNGTSPNKVVYVGQETQGNVNQSDDNVFRQPEMEDDIFLVDWSDATWCNSFGRYDEGHPLWRGQSTHL